MQKKFFSALLVAMLIFAFAVVASAVEISTAEQLFDLMNTGDDWVAPAEDATDDEKAAAEAAKQEAADKLALDYKLTADIDLTGFEGQSPIGRREIPFTGTFDGDGHTIKGIKIDGSNGEFKETALFGGTVGATFLNLTVEGSIKSNGNNVGGIAGRAILPLTVSNCVNKATVEMSVMGQMIGIGGIVGSCVLGDNYSPELIVENCANYGEVKSMSNKSAYASGIVGYIQARKGADAPYYLTIRVSGCVNYAPVSAAFATVGGGVVGYADFAGAGISGSFTLVDSANFGNIAAMSYNGGVAGAIGGDKSVTGMVYNVGNLYNGGVVSGFSDSSSNSGSVIGLIRVPAVIDGVNPVNVFALMDDSDSATSVVGSVSALILDETNVTGIENFALSGLYTAKGSTVAAGRAVANGEINEFIEVPLVLSNCAFATSDEAELAALVATNSSWAMVDGKPTLTYFADIIASAADAEVVEIENGPAIVPTPVIPTPVEPTAGEDVGAPADAPEADASNATSTDAPAKKAPVAIIIAIVAVVVVAVVVVIVVKKKK